MSPNPFSALFPKMDPELRDILSTQRSIKQFKPDRSNIKLIRKAFVALTARWHNSPPMQNALRQCRKQQPWSEHMLSIRTRDGFDMPTKVYQPLVGENAAAAAAGGGLPVVLLMHGGGGCLGGLDTDDFICQYLCSKVKAVVVSIAYRLNPENVYPVPVLDTYDAMVWVQVNAGVKGSGIEDVDLSKGFVGCGVSGGGNLLSAAMWMAAEETLKKGDVKEVVVPKLSGVIMLMTGYPIRGHDKVRNVSLNLYPELCKSWDELIDAPIANRATMPDYMDMNQITDIKSPTVSLLNLPSDSPTLSHFTKRWYHQISGLDPWRDSTRLWLSILLHSKVELLGLSKKEFVPSLPGRPHVKVDDYDGLPHTWWSVFPQVSRTTQWMKDLVEGAKWTLATSESVETGQALRESKL